MKNSNYITISGWMINELKLNGNELIIFAIIYGFSQDGESKFSGSNKYLETATNSTRNTVKSCLKKLEEKKFIERTIIEVNKVKFNTFKTLIIGGSEIDPPYQILCEVCQELTCECQELTEGGQKLTQGGSKIDPNSTINNTNYKLLDNTTNKLMSEIEISSLSTEEEIKYFEVAKAFHSLFIKNLKDKKISAKKIENGKYKDFVTPIRLMYERDEVTDEQFKEVFKYLSSPEGDFWTSNILSTTKLRKQFTTLLLQNGRKKSSTNDNRSAAEKTRSAVENYVRQSTAGN